MKNDTFIQPGMKAFIKGFMNELATLRQAESYNSTLH